MSAGPRTYYNENDQETAAWLRALIKAGAIADGEVDTRSILDVDAGELAGFVQCHFFAGIGGWSYALRLAGWPDDRPVWTGSCPCQPWSAANVWKRTSGHDDERHLWPAWFRLLELRRPGVVFGEQVASDDGLEWLDGVSSDLEGADYAIGAADLCATGFRPHRRQRLFFVADTARAGSQGLARHGDDGRESGRERTDPARSRRDADLWGGVSFMLCRDGRDRPVPLADGIPGGVDDRRPVDRSRFAIQRRRALMIHGYGNAIVPDVAAAFVRAYMGLNRAA